MIRAIAALALASASTQPSPALTSTAPWWEKVTVTVGDDGSTHSCQYSSSLGAGTAQDCSVVGAEASVTKTSAGASSGAKDKVTRITFERRFSPGTRPTPPSLEPGELLIGGQVMALAIDGKGAVDHCQVVATSGSVTPEYGCNEAQAERFDASVSSVRSQAGERAGFMTILVYGHSEHVV